MAYKERLQQNNTDLNEILADLDQLPNMPVPNPPAAYQNLEVTENGTYTAGAGYDAIGQVTVDVVSGVVPKEKYSVTFNNYYGYGIMEVTYLRGPTESFNSMPLSGNTVTIEVYGGIFGYPKISGSQALLMELPKNCINLGGEWYQVFEDNITINLAAGGMGN